MQKIATTIAIAILLFSTSAFATQQLVSLHGRATSAGSLINNGNLRAYIYNASSGGTLVYDSGTDFQNTINNGLFDVMLGSGSNTLDLNYGQYYWLDLEINGSDLDFNGNERKQFESTNGAIQNASIANEAITNNNVATNAAIDWNKISKTNAQITDLQTTTDFNNSFFNQRDANSTFWKQNDLNSFLPANYYSKTDTNTIFWKQNDLNAWLPNNYYSQSDANNAFWKQTDLNTELTNYPKKSSDETITGNWAINGITTFSNGFGSNGATMQNGILYAQSLVLAKDFNAATITGIDINGHHLPSIDNTWDLGSATKQWRAIYAQNATLSTISLPNNAISWAMLNKTGSTLADLVTRNHNDLQNIQGGTANEYYHLTSTQHTSLTGINGIWKTINASSGSTTADSLTDNLNIVGGTNINTTISGDTLTIDYTGSQSTDTNWQTSYPALDANLALTFYKQNDLNNNRLFVKTSDSNNVSRLDYRVIANPPWETDLNYADLNNNFVPYQSATKDLNFWDYNAFFGKRIGIGTTDPTSPLHIVYSGTDTINPMVIDASDSSLDTKIVFGVRTAATGAQKAFSLWKGTDSLAFASFEYNVGGTGKPGFALGPGGSTTRDVNLFRDATNVLRTNSSFIVDRNMGIGITSPGARLDINGGTNGIDLLVGGDQNSTIYQRNNSVNKVTRIGLAHFDTSEEPQALIFGANNSLDNNVSIGGGSSYMNAATIIRFYTAANNTTVTGTERMRIASDGTIGIGTTIPGSSLDVNGSIISRNNIFAGRTSGLYQLDINGDSNGVTSGVNARITNISDENAGAAILNVLSGSNAGDPASGYFAAFHGNYNSAVYRNKIAFVTNSDANGIVLNAAGSGNDIRFLTGGTERVRIFGDGNVGIGTNNPKNKLNVSGDTNTTLNNYSNKLITGTNKDISMAAGDINANTVYYTTLTAKSPVFFRTSDNNYTIFCYYAENENGTTTLIGKWDSIKKGKIEEQKIVNHPACVKKDNEVKTYENDWKQYEKEAKEKCKTINSYTSFEDWKNNKKGECVTNSEQNGASD